MRKNTYCFSCIVITRTSSKVDNSQKLLDNDLTDTILCATYKCTCMNSFSQGTNFEHLCTCIQQLLTSV